MSSTMQDPVDVLTFWWQAGPEKWFQSGTEFDDAIRTDFGDLYERAFAGERDDWMETPHGTLALLLLLDQFSRNMFRQDARAFQSDPKALAIAENALANRFHLAYPAPATGFFFLPFEHAEDMDAQERSVDLFRQHGDQEGYLYALIHMDVIRRFGRFPHRNAVLGRQSTEAEIAFLKNGGFAA